MLGLFLSFTASAQIRSFESSGCLSDGDIPTLKCLEVVFQNILFMSSALVMLIIFVMFVIGGFLWLTSGGDEQRLAKAKGTLTWAIVGLILYLTSYVILSAIDILFLGGKGELFNFTIPEFE